MTPHPAVHAPAFGRMRGFLMAASALLGLLLVSPRPAVADSASDFSYALTTSDDPVSPGEIASFKLTATNLTNAAQSATLTYQVPNYTTDSGHSAGASRSVGFNLAAGQTSAVVINLVVLNGGSATPPEGTVINLSLLDPSRSVTVSRSVVTQSAPVADLKLSTDEGTVKPGGTFAYTLVYRNTGASALAGAQVTLPVPAGTAFVSASDNVTPSAGVLTWPLPTLAPGAVGQVQATFTVPASGNGAALLIEAKLLDSGNHALASASTTKTIAATPALAYALTTSDDPVTPGETASFQVTATNLTNAVQNATLTYQVPSYTTDSGHTAGATRSVGFSLAAGQTAATVINLDVLNGGSATPPEGTIINLALTDLDRAATVSRSIVARSAPMADLKLSTKEGKVKPGGTFAYTLAYHNTSSSAIAGAQITLPVPKGAGFVSASDNATPTNGPLSWNLGTLAPGAVGQVQATFTAPASGNGAALLIDAKLLDGGNHLLASATTAKAISATPALAYSVTTSDDPVKPGQTASFKLTATNLTNGTQNATLYFQVPNYTTVAGHSAGAERSVGFSLAAGQTSAAVINVDVLNSGASTPPENTIINLSLTDFDRGVTVSRSILAQSAPVADLKLATNEATVKPGGIFTYTLAYHNTSANAISGAQVLLPVPVGASFVSASDNVTPNGDLLTWSLDTLAPGAVGQVQATFTAPAAGDGAGLLIEARLLDGGQHLLASASSSETIDATPDFAYALTTLDDPVAPGQTASFKLTATNLTNGTQSATLVFQVPNYTDVSGHTAGAARSVGFTLAAGESYAAVVNLDVLSSGSSAPPEGTLLNLSLTDLDRGATISRNILARSAPLADLKLANDGGSAKPGEQFTYTLVYHNPGGTAISGAQVTLPVPAGAGFVSASNSVTPSGGVLAWPLGTLAPGAVGQVQATFTAPAAGNGAALLIEAKLLDGGNHLLASASSTKTVTATPDFTYQLTTSDDPVAPGQVASFVVTVTNQTNGTQSTTLTYQVPNYTDNNGHTAGAARSVSFNVAALGTASATINLDILNSGSATPPDGTIIDFSLTDLDRNATIARSILTKKPPGPTRLISLSGSLAFGNVVVGKSAQATLTIANSGNSALTVSKITYPSGFSGSFSGTIAAGESHNVTVTFAATAKAAFGGTVTVVSDATGGTGTTTASGTGVDVVVPPTFPSGGYYGLSESGDGYLKVVVTHSGQFTGKAVVNRVTYTLTGKFDRNGDFSSHAGKPPVAVTLHSGSNGVSGTVGGEQFTVAHAVVYAAGQAAPEAARYTVLLNPTETGAEVPQGIGYATLTVSKTGAVMLTAGKLADRTSFSAAGVLVADQSGHAQFPFYDTAINSGKGRLWGAVTFDATTTSDCDGVLNWFKPASKTSKYFADGIDTTLSLAGAKYLPPANGATTPLPPFTAKAGNATLYDANFGDLPAITESLTVSVLNKVTVNGDNPHHLAIAIQPAAGSFSGSFIHPQSHQRITFSGLLDENAMAPHGGGCYLGPVVGGIGYSGSVLLTP